MKALILAAGRGSRLNSKTKKIPKALVKIKKKEILNYQLDNLKKNNIRDVCIVVGYKSSKIIKFLRNKKKDFKFTIIKNIRYANTDSAYSYYLARNFVKNSSYIHLNCDIIFSNNHLKKILLSKKKNILSCRSDLELDEKMDLIKIKKLLIIKFDNKFFREANFKVFGLAKINSETGKKLCEMIHIDIKKKRINKKCFSYFKYLVKKFKISYQKTTRKQLIEINTLKDFKKYN